MEYAVRKKNRLSDFDYSAPGAYFVTICTENRKNLFWREAMIDPIEAPILVLSGYGEIVEQGIKQIPRCYPSVTVDHYVIMPNHIHLLLQIHSDADGRPMTAPTIAWIVNHLKGNISKRIGKSVWQKGFYDHIVRSQKEYTEIWRYIDGNPGKWAEDELCRDVNVDRKR